MPCCSQAKQVALDRKLSLKAVVEAALRQFLDQPQAFQQPAFKLRKCTFKGQGRSLASIGTTGRRSAPELRRPGRVIAFDTNILLHAHGKIYPGTSGRTDVSLHRQNPAGLGDPLAMSA